MVGYTTVLLMVLTVAAYLTCGMFATRHRSGIGVKALYYLSFLIPVLWVVLLPWGFLSLRKRANENASPTAASDYKKFCLSVLAFFVIGGLASQSARADKQKFEYQLTHDTNYGEGTRPH